MSQETPKQPQVGAGGQAPKPVKIVMLREDLKNLVNTVLALDVKEIVLTLTKDGIYSRNMNPQWTMMINFVLQRVEMGYYDYDADEKRVIAFSTEALARIMRTIKSDTVELEIGSKELTVSAEGVKYTIPIEDSMEYSDISEEFKKYPCKIVMGPKTFKQIIAALEKAGMSHAKFIVTANGLEINAYNSWGNITLTFKLDESNFEEFEIHGDKVEGMYDVELLAKASKALPNYNLALYMNQYHMKIETAIIAKAECYIAPYE